MTYITSAGTVFARFSPHSYTNVAALCIKCIIMKICTSICKSLFLLQPCVICFTFMDDV